MHAHHCGDRHAGPRRGPGEWAGFDPAAFGAFFSGGGRQHRGGPFGRRRMFDQGDLRYVILQLLAEKPRHGYDIIKALEERFGGWYTPSPGTVYPTLAMLEDLGFAKTTPEESGKKIFEITDAGRAHLKEHKPTVDEIFARVADFGGAFLSEGMMSIHRAMRDVARATYASAAKHPGDKDAMTRIRDLLRKVADEIEALAAEK